MAQICIALIQGDSREADCFYVGSTLLNLITNKSDDFHPIVVKFSFNLINFINNGNADDKWVLTSFYFAVESISLMIIFQRLTAKIWY